MAENIRKCHILRKMSAAGLKTGREHIRSYFAEGMNAPELVRPENVIVWVSSDDSGLNGEYVHQRLVLKIALRGHVRTMLDGRPFTMSPGEGVLFFPYQVHATQRIQPEKGAYSFAAVTFALRPEELTRIHSLRNRVFPVTAEDERALIRLLAAYQNPDDGAAQREAVWLLAGILLRQNMAAERSFPRNGNETDADFLRICEYIRTHLRENISIKTLADAFGVSRETVRRQFRRHFRTFTPAEMLRKLRLQMAVEQLELTEDSIAKVASDCGYSTAFIFSNAFKHVYGIAPSEYRKRFRKF